MIRRKLESELTILRNEFPIIAIMGPRQSGKTTLSKSFFKGYEYISLEDPDIKRIAADDPKGFLNSLSQKFILDEIQNVPELFSYLQRIADEKENMGEIVITGSQNYLLSEKISQSLSGRVAVTTLLPFSYSELFDKNSDGLNSTKYILNGSYPPVYARNIRPARFYAAYVSTYIERDVRRILNIKDLAVFEKFLRLLAGRTGQLLNKNELATQAGVTHITVENWLSVLEQSYVIFRMQPYYKNIVKRQIKQTKLYFYDSGLATWLAGIKSDKELEIHYLYGALFENMVVSEVLKSYTSMGESTPVYFWRDSHGNEIDLVVETGGETKLIEIKSSATFRPSFLKTILKTENKFDVNSVNKILIYNGDKQFYHNEVSVYPWRDYFESHK